MKSTDKKTLKRNEIILKSLDLILTKGYNGTGVQDIANSAGIPKGSFYNYFKSKEDFAVEILEYYTDNRLELLNRYLFDESLTYLERIEKLFSDQIEVYRSEDFSSIGYLVCKLCLEMADTNPLIAKASEKAFDTLTKPITDCLEAGINSGEFDPGINIEQLSIYIQNSWFGALVHTKAIKNSEPLEIFNDVLSNILLKRM